MQTEFCGLNSLNPTLLVDEAYPWGWKWLDMRLWIEINAVCRPKDNNMW